MSDKAHRRQTWLEKHNRPFDLEQHGDILLSILQALREEPRLNQVALSRILCRYPLPNGTLLSKGQVLRGYRQLCRREGQPPDPEIIHRLRIKPTRSISGVTPVAVMTEPYPCPGHCIFCPSAEGFPTSYLPGEPSAQRGRQSDYDPFEQTAGRISALQFTGHSVDKIELIVQGGSWSAYPPDYQEWFVRRCLEAMNGVPADSLEQAQRRNERADHRNVGLDVETRPDLITVEEVRRLRRLGVTKVQLGLQCLDDRILDLNRRGHGTAEIRRAMRLLRLAGFKIVVHWMPNQLGATPEGDWQDFQRLWDDPAIRPDELKIYPTALLADTELYRYWQRGQYAPYDLDTMTRLLADCKEIIPPYCRVNRLMRDIPSPLILAGVRKSNLRQIVQQRLEREGRRCRCIRCREIRGQRLDPDSLELERVAYATDATDEIFLQYVDDEGRLAGFLRLSLPREPAPLEELAGCAVIREVHVYGPALDLESKRPGAAQHAGLGTQLLEEAARLARQADYGRLAVIAAIGTRPYYRERGFTLGELYMARYLAT
ncbi:MAG: tRNA uridine(34) 5-carboxymethylaminomethyl modification radical SAM/GNAT enzyme Elp3 [Chloroflexia bacterium]|nr:tRNA uridine(34) 5-carboxymethylaminomethyl modification radical SAM/GNAT enzyme Elp3 [Chloroflexia bacterium]